MLKILASKDKCDFDSDKVGKSEGYEGSALKLPGFIAFVFKVNWGEGTLYGHLNGHKSTFDNSFAKTCIRSI